MMVVGADDWSIAQQSLCFSARGGQRFVNTQLNLSFGVKLLENFNFSKTAARILHLGPTKLNIALDSKHDGTFSFSSSRPGNMTLY